MTTKRALSGIQKQVLSLYRQVLRTSRSKNASTRQAVQGYARQEVERYRDVKPTNVQLIEHLLRKGHKQLATLQDPAFTRFTWQGPSTTDGGNAARQ